MSFLAALCLHLLHFLYSTSSTLFSFWQRHTRIPPLALTAARAKLPKHLAIILDILPDTQQTDILETVDRATEWCRTVGITQLTLYDRRGLLHSFNQQIREHVVQVYPLASDSGESDLEYPLTPPPSDYSISRPMSPENSVLADLDVSTIHVVSQSRPKQVKTRRNVVHKRRERETKPLVNPLTLYLVSPKSSKPAIASAARSFVKLCRVSGKAPNEFNLMPEQLQLLLEGEQGFPPPDLLITPPRASHTGAELPLELYGFPPWQMRLTEISRGKFDTCRADNVLGNANDQSLIDEVTFRRALDEYSGAEMRLGK
ncbi:hypothetical protein HGRIS_007969 [Hohenbuehelia grisea]|uniref:ditrans,polycis-polyprenyl diphosphate synthase [(2E,6E)-farnesyldiphosphate specific] n=1 Tax=Hohenbuehelia grisea TaxID=104357 RepID=A0ABR3J793_9AGAR